MKCVEIEKPITRKEALRVSNEILEQAEKERYMEQNGKFKWSNDEWYGLDKLGHLIAGTIISAIAFLIFDYLFLNSGVEWKLALLSGTVANVAKEVGDMDTTGFSYRDLVWGTLGNVIGVLLFY